MHVGPVVIYQQYPYGGGPVPPPRCEPVPQEAPEQPSWPAPELPGERDDRTWDPYDPPLHG